MFLQQWGSCTGYTRDLNRFVLPGVRETTEKCWFCRVKGRIAQPYMLTRASWAITMQSWVRTRQYPTRQFEAVEEGFRGCLKRVTRVTLKEANQKWRACLWWSGVARGWGIWAPQGTLLQLREPTGAPEGFVSPCTSRGNSTRLTRQKNTWGNRFWEKQSAVEDTIVTLASLSCSRSRSFRKKALKVFGFG